MVSRNVRGLIWGGIEKLSSQASSFIIGIILARLLTPEDYGTIGLIVIFITISNVFVDSGFGNALIRKSDRGGADCSTAFYFNIAIGVVLYAVLFFCAPFIARLFDTQVLIPLTRIVGLSVLIASFSIVQRSLLIAELNIKKITKITLLSQIPSGIIAIIMAYKGFGVYSLAAQQVCTQLLVALSLWMTTKWRPKCEFSIESFRYLWGFGSKLTTATFIGVIFDQAYAFIIGKFISKKELGYYSKANSLACQPNQIVSGIIERVALPVFSVYQNDIPVLKDMYRKYICGFFCITVPIACVLFILAQDIVMILWGNKWLPAVPIFRCLLIAGLLSPLTTFNLYLLQVLGRTDLTLKLEFIKKPLYAITICALFQFGLNGILASLVINNVIASVVNTIPANKLIGYRCFDQFKDILKYMLIGAMSLLIVLLFEVNISLSYKGFIGAFLFCLIFYSIMILIKDRYFGDIMTALKSIAHK